MEKQGGSQKRFRFALLVDGLHIIHNKYLAIMSSDYAFRAKAQAVSLQDNDEDEPIHTAIGVVRVNDDHDSV